MSKESRAKKMNGGAALERGRPPSKPIAKIDKGGLLFSLCPFRYSFS
jgi:hypothetical protein